MRVYVKNIPAKCHPDPTLNDVAFGFFHDGLPNKKDKKNKINEMCSDDIHEISSRSN